MEIITEKQNGAVIVKIAGNLDSTTSKEAQDKILSLIEPGCHIVFDMSQCPFVSSAGLRVLLMAAKQLTKSGGKSSLACLSDEIKEVLEMTGFNTIFESYDTVPAAVESS